MYSPDKTGKIETSTEAPVEGKGVDAIWSRSVHGQMT